MIRIVIELLHCSLECINKCCYLKKQVRESCKKGGFSTLSLCDSGWSGGKVQRLCDVIIVKVGESL